MTILVVDDESGSRELLTEILTGEGYQVRAADGGELALASAAVIRPELILLDIRMPGMDGFEVCRRLKRNPETRDIPIMFLSAGRELRGRVEGFRMGGVDFVSKPFQREELLARVSTHLELGRLRAHLEAQVAERTAELRESEQRFRTMADAAPVMIWIADDSKLCTFFNNPWLKFTGRSIEQELGNGWVAGVHPDDLERCYRIYSSSFDQRRTFQMEYRLRRADGEYRWVLDSGVPRFAPGGAFGGYIGSCVDITDFKQNLDKMVAAQNLESLGLMAAGIAHDFGNLLMSIFLETDLALTNLQPDAPQRENLERIYSLTACASEIVNLLRASAGASTDSKSMQPADLSSLVEQTLLLIKGSISRRADVRTSLPSDLPAVWGNAAQIRQVVMNLISNASEALGDKEGVITVTAERVALGPESAGRDLAHLPDGEYVSLTVSDSGSGMSAETRARIFDQFFTTKSLGRGLGLAAVRGIVRSHGGAINVVSAPGKGARFEVWFPCLRHKEDSLDAMTDFEARSLG